MSNDRARKAGEHARWEAHKELLRVMWLEEKKTLDQVREFMSECHSFHAEKWVYEAKFRQWNFRKKLQGDSWRIIGDVVEKRKREGKESDVFDNEILIPPKKVCKETGRKRARPSGNADDKLPPGVEVRTPKMIASNQVARTGRSSKFSRRPLLPNPNSRPSHADPSPWILTDPLSNFSLDAFGGGWDGCSIYWPNDEVVLSSSMTRDNNSAVLPIWAKWDNIALLDLPWIQFHALVFSSGNMTALNSPIQSVTECLGSNVEPLAHQERGSSFQRRAKDTEVTTILKEQRGAAFDLEEFMPESFRIDVSDSSQTLNTLSKNSSAIQMADISLFLASNNILDDFELFQLIKRILDSNHRHIFERFFKLKSPTIQAYSGRILESLSSTISLYNSHRTLRDLLHYGLDRSILAGPTGGRCLQLAIHHKNEALALLLLQTGVQKNPKLGSKQPFNQTPVQLARLHDQETVLQVLLGLDHKQPSPRPFVQPPESEAELPLTKACEDGDFEQIRLLLDAGVDVDYYRYSWSIEPILDWVFFENRECYDILLPYSELAKQFWTVSGILSAASAGRHELDAYFACKREPENDDEVFDRVMLAGLEHGNYQEIHIILDSKLVLEWLDLDSALMTAVISRNLDIMAKLVQLGADLEILGSVKDEYLVDTLISGPEAGELKGLLEIGLFCLEDAFKMNLELMRDAPVPFDGLGNLKFLVEEGLDLETAIYMNRDEELKTPLQLTIKWGSLDMVECLIDAGALVNNTADATFYTNLGEAVRVVSPQMVKLLLERGADVKSFATRQDMTLLELFVSTHPLLYGNRIGVFQALLEAGADLNGPTSRMPGANWNTALTTAIIDPRTDEEISLLLNAGADIHQSGGGEKARTPLQAAVESGRRDIIEELLKRGADVNAPAAPDHGRTALQAACGSGKRTADIISLLLNAGADVSAPAAPRYGRTALQAVCSSNAPSSELMSLLVRSGAEIEAPPAKYGGITALQGAAIMGNIKILMILIDIGADINAPPAEHEGRMALDGAAEHGRLDIVQLLLRFGATCVTPGSTGYDSAIQFAEENGHFVIADILQRYNGGFEGELVDSEWLESLGM